MPLLLFWGEIWVFGLFDGGFEDVFYARIVPASCDLAETVVEVSRVLTC